MNASARRSSVWRWIDSVASAHLPAILYLVGSSQSSEVAAGRPSAITAYSLLIRGSLFVSFRCGMIQLIMIARPTGSVHTNRRRRRAETGLCSPPCTGVNARANDYQGTKSRGEVKEEGEEESDKKGAGEIHFRCNE